MGDHLWLAGEGSVKVGDNISCRAFAITAFENFGSGLVEFDQTFRVEQDMGILAGFPAENIVRAEL